jgi:hypothetical protein
LRERYVSDTRGHARINAFYRVGKSIILFHPPRRRELGVVDGFVYVAGSRKGTINIEMPFEGLGGQALEV